MAKLKRGAVTIDLETGGVYGDLAHCPREDLLESAQALLQLLPHLEGRRVWGLAKAFDSDTYIYTKGRDFPFPKVEIPVAEGVDFPGRQRQRVVFGGSDGRTYWWQNWYEELVGSVKDGQVVPDTEGVPDLTAPNKAEKARWLYQHRLKHPEQTRLPL
jgi:hypothetical protein